MSRPSRAATSRDIAHLAFPQQSRLSGGKGKCFLDQADERKRFSPPLLRENSLERSVALPIAPIVKERHAAARRKWLSNSSKSTGNFRRGNSSSLMAYSYRTLQASVIRDLEEKKFDEHPTNTRDSRD